MVVLKAHISIRYSNSQKMNTSSVYPICDMDINTSWLPSIMEYIFGVIGNIIALVLLWINRKNHKWKSFYKLFTGLALTDLLGVFLVYPFSTMRYTSHFTYCFPEPLCQFVSFIFVDAHISSAMLICAMSIDRYLNLVKPHLVQARHEGRKYTLVLAGIWIAGSLISMLQLVGVGDSELMYPGSWCYFDFVSDTTGNRVMSYMYSVFGFFIVLVTILANILTMYRMCWDPITGGILLDADRVSGSTDAHVMIFIIAVTIVFFVLWTPLPVSKSQI
jgi:prostaglandin E receptor 4